MRLMCAQIWVESSRWVAPGDQSRLDQAFQNGFKPKGLRSPDFR
jgi:hypothetical protein